MIFSWVGNLQNLLVFICKSKAKNTWKFELLSQSIRISMNGKIFCPYFRIVLSCKYKMMGNMIYQRFVSNIYNLQYNLLVLRGYFLYYLLELLLQCNFAISLYWKCSINYIVKWIREIFDVINCSQHKLVLHEL